MAGSPATRSKPDRDVRGQKPGPPNRRASSLCVMRCLKRPRLLAAAFSLAADRPVPPRGRRRVLRVLWQLDCEQKARGGSDKWQATVQTPIALLRSELARRIGPAGRFAGLNLGRGLRARLRLVHDHAVEQAELADPRLPLERTVGVGVTRRPALAD